jgi:hypothetical protein
MKIDLHRLSLPLCRNHGLKGSAPKSWAQKNYFNLGWQIAALLRRHAQSEASFIVEAAE